MAEDNLIPEGAVELNLEEGKRYSFCTCGFSKKLPFCDESHRIVNEQEGSNYKSLKVVRVDNKFYISSKNWKRG